MDFVESSNCEMDILSGMKGPLERVNPREIDSKSCVEVLEFMEGVPGSKPAEELAPKAIKVVQR
jgi:hypothetical protein